MTVVGAGVAEVGSGCGEERCGGRPEGAAHPQRRTGGEIVVCQPQLWQGGNSAGPAMRPRKRPQLGQVARMLGWGGGKFDFGGGELGWGCEGVGWDG